MKTIFNYLYCCALGWEGGQLPGTPKLHGQAGFISGARATKRLKRKMGEQTKEAQWGGVENDRLVLSVHRGTSWNLT